MKKGYFIKMLSVCVLYLFQPFCLCANQFIEIRIDNSPQLVEDENKVVSVVGKYGGLPKVNGFKLVKTNTIGGLKCEHYENDKGEKCRVFINAKGDYITIPEDKDGFDFEPSYNSYYIDNYSGPYKLHVNDGGILEIGAVDTRNNYMGNNLIIKKYTFKNGNVVYFGSDTYEPGGVYSWSDFKNGMMVDKSISDMLTVDYYYNFILGKNKDYVLQLSSDSNKLLSTKIYRSSNRCNWHYRGIKIDGGVYSLNTEGNLVLIAKEFEGDFIPCVASDSIISFSYTNSYNYEIRYANGDWFCFKGGYPYGQLHRGNAILMLDGSDSNEWARIKNSDGSVFAGSIAWNLNLVTGWSDPFDLAIANWLPYKGRLRYPDGRSVDYISGESEVDRNARQKAAEEKKNAEIKAIYNEACKKYGKKYVDAATQGNIIVGMPEELFVIVFKPRLVKSETHRNCYYVYGMSMNNSGTRITNKKVTKMVWVTNGKVSSITNNPKVISM